MPRPPDAVTPGASAARTPPDGFGIDILRALEADLALFEPSVRGFSLWPVVRFPAWQLVSNVQIRALDDRGGRNLRRAGLLAGVLAYGGWSLAQRRRLRGRRFDALFLTLEAHRSVRHADGWWDPYLDDVAAHPSLADRVLRLERRHFAVSRRRTVAKRHLFADLRLLDELRLGKRAHPRELNEPVARLNDLLFDRLRRSGVAVDAARERAFRGRCERSARRFHDEMVWFEGLLDDVRPAVVGLVDAYNEHGLVAAARARGVPVVEFQHGSIHPDHPGYIWSAGAGAIRDRLPIPDCIATYGAYWSEILSEHGFWTAGEVPAVGSARMDWTRRQSARPRATGAGLRIMFTSQYATRGGTIPLLAEFIRLAEKEAFDYALVIKVHRAERGHMGDYEELARLSPRVSVVSPYEDDTLRLIAGADVHVSGWSTCHFEAVGLGTPTVVLSFAGPDRARGLKEFSAVFAASSAREMLDCVARVREAQRVSVDAWRAESERLFRPDAVENAARLLAKFAAR